jgi:sugar (pentulose or hexulose) kinase
MPPFARASDDLGEVRAALVAQGVPRMRVQAGVHDSSANFHRYRAAGLEGVCVISTGTWIVAMADRIAPAGLDPRFGMTLNADVGGAPLGGALTMGGRDYAVLAGVQPEGARADPAVLARLTARGTMALPSFGASDGQFPGTAGKGRIVGPGPEDAAERLALAVLYVAALTLDCGNRLDPDRPWVLDGSFLRDPAFAALVAALRPMRETWVHSESYGIAAGAAALCARGRAMPPLHLTEPEPLPGLPGLTDYIARWRALAKDAMT